MSDVREQLEQIGAGVFIRDRAWESRLTAADFWRAYEERVIIWVRSDDSADSHVEALAPLLRKFPQITELRFGGTRVTPGGVDRLRLEWPQVRVTASRPN